jgi:hypothetical protein
MRVHFCLSDAVKTMCGLTLNFRLRSTRYYRGVNCPNCKRAWRDQAKAA